MTMASIGQKILAFLYFTLIARTLGVEDTGKYFLALSFTTVFVVFIDLGLTNVMIREIAKQKDFLQKYFSNIFFVKIFLAVLVYIAAIIFANVFGYGLEVRHMIYLSAVTMVFDTFHLTAYGALRAMHNVKYEAIGIVLSQGITLILGTIFLFLKFPLIFLIFAFTFASFVNFCFALWVLKNKYNISLKPRYDKLVFRHFLFIFLPFALAAIFARIYSYADTLILSKMMGNSFVGIYSIPYKITYAFQFIPVALVAALYPKLSDYYVSAREKMGEVLEFALKYLFVIVFPIAIGIMVLSEDLILFLYGKNYLPSVLPLQVLIMSLIFSYVSFPVGAFLNAAGRQTLQMKIVAFVTFVNIFANIWLIPEIGVVGAAIAAALGNFLLTAVGFYFIPKITKVDGGRIFSIFLRVAFAACIMGISVYALNMQIPFYLTIPVGAVIYIAMLFIFKVVSIPQIKELLLLVRK